MRLHVLSDLHLEFAPFQPPKSGADVIVLAGDLHNGIDGLAWIHQHFPGTPVLYVPGNHEYYGHAIPSLTQWLREETAGTSIHVLENDSIQIQGVDFLGCTLWTDFRLLGNPGVACLVAEDIMADYGQIRVSPAYRRLRAADTAKLHEATVRWLKAMLKAGPRRPTVIITHHAPSRRSLEAKYAGDMLSAAFASDLDHLVEQSGARLWIHGHTHHSVDYALGATRVLSNQRGYPGETTARFNPGLVVEI